MWRIQLAPACRAECRLRTQPPTTAARRQPATWAAQEAALVHLTETPAPQHPRILRIRIPTRRPCIWILLCPERVSINCPFLLRSSATLFFSVDNILTCIEFRTAFYAQLNISLILKLINVLHSGVPGELFVGGRRNAAPRAADADSLLSELRALRSYGARHWLASGYFRKTGKSK